MGREDHLILLRQLVQDLTGYFLQMRMKENLGIFHNDHAGDPLLIVRVRLKQRQHIDALHAPAEIFNGVQPPVFFVVCLRRHMEHLIRIAVQGELDFFESAVPSVVGVDLLRKLF